MQYSTNYNLNKPQPADQFNIEHWNQNTDTIDSQMHANEVDIATNKADISTIIANLTSNKSSDSSSTYFKLMNLIYPVGSIYWSGISSNPSTLFGGTWVQIKDRFVWAKGDSDTVNTTGGSKTVTLTTSNMPSHTHSFTPKGTVSSHSHGLNGHTHTFTPSGTVSSHSHTINSGNTSSAGTKTTAGIRHSGSTGQMSANETGTIQFNRYINTGITSQSGNLSVDSSRNVHGYSWDSSSHTYPSAIICNVSHTHTLPASYIYGSTDSTQPTFTGTSGTTGASSGSTALSQPMFTGTDGTTGASGSGTAVNIMPPYVVKYCWERTA